MKKGYKELLSNTTVFAVSSLLSKVILMLMLPIFTSELTTEQYGIAELAVNVSTLVIPMASLAIQDAVFRFTVDKSIPANEVYKASFWIMASGSVLLLFISAFFYYYTPLQPWRWWFWGFSTLSMYRNALSLYAKGTDRTRIFAVDSVLYNVVLAAANVVFLCVFHWKVEGYFAALMIAQLFSIAFLLMHVEKPAMNQIFTFPLNKKIIQKMLVYSSPLVLNSISWNLTHTVDRVMLEQLRTTSDVGIYSAATKIPSLISTVMNIFIQAWTISAIRSFEDEEGKTFYAQVFRYIEMLLVFVTIGVLLINNHVVVLLFGADFKLAVHYTPILMIATSVLFYANYFGPIFSSMQKSGTLMSTTLFGTVINAVLNYFFIRSWGIYGACMATLASNAVVSISRIALARKYYPFQIEWKLFWGGWLLIVCAVGATLVGGPYAELIDLSLFGVAAFLYRRHLGGLLTLIKERLTR